MPITVADLLSMHELGLRLLAGSAGVGNVVRWAHSIELPDPGPWLKGQEFVLTTGMKLSNDPEAQRAYVRQIGKAGAAALGFAVGLGFDTTPIPFYEVADELGMPLLEVPIPTPFIAITEAVAARLEADRQAEQERTVSIQQDMSRAAVTKGLPGVLKSLLSARGDEAVVLELPDRVVWPTEGAPGALVGRVKEELSSRVPLPKSFSMAFDDGRLIVQTIGPTPRRGTLVLAVARADVPTRYDKILLAQAASLLALEARVSDDALETERHLRGLLVTDLLVGVVHKEQLGKLGFGRDGASIYVVRADNLRVSQRRIEECLRADELSFLMAMDGRELVIVLRGSPGDQLKRSVSALLREALGEAWSAGHSGPVPFAEFARGVQDARTSMSLAQGRKAEITDLSGIDSTEVLLRSLGQAPVAALRDRIVGPLLAYDGSRGGELLTSLETFLLCNGHANVAAARLGIHRHTLRYRLDRIEKVLDRDLSRFADRQEIWLGLTAWKVAKESPAIIDPSPPESGQ